MNKKEMISLVYCFSILIGLGFYCELNSHIETMADKSRGGGYRIISGDQKVLLTGEK